MPAAETTDEEPSEIGVGGELIEVLSTTETKEESIDIGVARVLIGRLIEGVSTAETKEESIDIGVGTVLIERLIEGVLTAETKEKSSDIGVGTVLSVIGRVIEEGSDEEDIEQTAAVVSFKSFGVSLLRSKRQ